MFKRYDLVYYKGKLVQYITETVDNTAMIHLIPGNPATTTEVKKEYLKSAERHLMELVPNLTGEGLSKIIENIGIDHDSEFVLSFLAWCTRMELDLNPSLDHIKFYLHDLMRKFSPSLPREKIYLFSKTELINCILYFEEMLDGRQIFGSSDGYPIPGCPTQKQHDDGSICEKGRDDPNNELP